MRVEAVSSGAPAKQAGVEVGDIVVAVGKQRIEQVSDLLRLLGREAVGEPLEIKVLRPVAVVFREFTLRVTPVQARQ